MSPPLGEGSEVAGKYRVIRHLGSGGMGHVYAARDLQRGETVALKVLPGDKRRDVRARSRLVLEGRAAAGVQHPGIVRIHDVGEAGEITYVAMELLEGEDLHERMRRRGALPIDEVLALARALLDAMSAMHDADIIHRDLKPRNLFLARDADGGVTLKVLDFGIAKSLAPSDHALTDSGQVFGTLHYMAPEQLRGVKHADVRSEIWAAGAILYEALTGRPPFEAENGPELVLKIAIEMPDPVRLHRPDVPDGLRRAIARAMQRDPAARFAGAREMLAAIDATEAEAPTLLDADTRPIGADELAALSGMTQHVLAGASQPASPTFGRRAGSRARPRGKLWPLVTALAALSGLVVTRGSEAVPEPAPGAERSARASAGNAADALPADDGTASVRTAEAALARAAITRAAELASMAKAEPGVADSVECSVTPQPRLDLAPRGGAGTPPAATPAASAGPTPTPTRGTIAQGAQHATAPRDPEAAYAAAPGLVNGQLEAAGAAQRPARTQAVGSRVALPQTVPSSAGELKRDEF